MIEEMIFWVAAGQAKVLRECMKNTGLKLVGLFDNNTDIESPFNVYKNGPSTRIGPLQELYNNAITNE